MAQRTLTIIAVADSDIAISLPASIPLRENRSHKVHLGQYVTGQSTPLTTTFSIAETTTGADAISGVGISNLKDGTYGDSVTLTELEAGLTRLNGTDEATSTLWIEFTLGDVTTDTTIELAFSDTAP